MGMLLSLNPQLLTRADRVLVGVSGGPDSLALLHALLRLREELEIHVTAAHVHHGMRGADADADVLFLETLCAAWSIPLAVERWDVPALAARQKLSVEEAGREARYRSFKRLARERGCGKVATAHTADDQAETVLLNLFRGAGIDGLAGIPPRRALGPERDSPEVIRPLLGVWRRDVEAYCQAHGLEPREDPTNQDTRFRRSRVRHELFPLLAPYDPQLKEHLVRLALQAREEGELMLPQAEALLQRAGRDGRSPLSARLPFTARLVQPVLDLDARVIAAAPPALARRALRLALRGAAGYDVELDAGLVERLLLLARGEGPSAVDLPGCPLRARRRGARLVLEGAGAPPAQRPGTTSVAVPGVTEAPEFGLTLQVEIVPPPADPRLSAEEVVLDRGGLSLPLLLRPPLPGDRLRPLGASGSRLLSDVFTDRKIPGVLRPLWPVLVDQQGIVWVVGLAVADRARISPGTRDCLHVAAVPLPER